LILQALPGLAERHPGLPFGLKGNQMTIQFEKLKARLLANPKVKAEYDALAREFEIADPESPDSGFDASHRPGMTAKGKLPR
jgi:hypothetical protein